MSLLSRHAALRLALALAFAVTVALGMAASAGAATAYRGVQLHSLWSSTSDGDMDRELDLTQQSGSSVVRVDVGWSSLEEKGKGQMASWYVDKLDRFMAGADSRGLKVIVTLWSTPCWASSAPETLKQGCAGSWWDRGVVQYAPTNMRDYGDVAAWVTSRYGRKLAALEVWNEPSLDGTRFWIAPDRAAAYASLLKAAYPAVKAADSGVEVLATLDGTDRAFLSAIYDQGAKGNYDGLAVHPYGDSNFSGVRAVRDMQRDYGDDRPVWLTEFGWATGENRDWAVSEAEQATRITDALTQLESLDWIRAAVLYEMRDEASDSSQMEDNWGLVRRDYTPKPGYLAFASALSGTTPPPTTIPPVVPPETVPPIVPPETVPPIVPPDTVPLVPPAPPADGDTPPEGDDQTPPPDRELTLEIKRQGKRMVAVGTGPSGKKVEISRQGCRKASDAKLTAEIDSDGRYSASLGGKKEVAGCQFEVKLA